MCTTNANKCTTTAQVSRNTETNVILPIDTTANPYTNVSTVIVDQEHLPIQGATIIVIENTGNYSTSNENGQVFLEDVDRNHSVLINYAGAKQTVKVAEIPAQIVFTDAMLTHQLDTVYLTPKPKPKAESNLIPNLVIGVCVAGVIYTVVKAINEEKESEAQPIHL